MIRPFSGPNYGKNGQPENACAHCGKAIKEPRYWVEVFDGGARYCRKDDDSKLNSVARCDGASYMAFYPVGSDCRKMLVADGVVVLTSDESGNPEPPTVNNERF